MIRVYGKSEDTVSSDQVRVKVIPTGRVPANDKSYQECRGILDGFMDVVYKIISKVGIEVLDVEGESVNYTDDEDGLENAYYGIYTFVVNRTVVSDKEFDVLTRSLANISTDEVKVDTYTVIYDHEVSENAFRVAIINSTKRAVEDAGSKVAALKNLNLESIHEVNLGLVEQYSETDYDEIVPSRCSTTYKRGEDGYCESESDVTVGIYRIEVQVQVENNTNCDAKLVEGLD